MTSVTIFVSVSGGACGDATISFEASPTLLAYLRDGTPQGFVAIDATLVSGSVVNMPTYMYTGDGATNKGWVLEASACTPSCAMDKVRLPSPSHVSTPMRP